MYRTIALLFMVIVMENNLNAQAFARKIDYQKTEQPVAMIELPTTTDVAENAIKDFMAKRGYKGAGFKEFTVFRATKLDDSDTAFSDLYFKIERKSHAEKSMTAITLLTTKKNEPILTRSLPDSLKMEQAKLFLNNLAPSIEAGNVNVEVNSQTEILKKAQKKLNQLKNDQNDLDKRMRSLQADLSQNKKDQLIQTQALQANVYGDDDAKKKAQKKMNKLMDDQGTLDGKIRKTQMALDQNKVDQVSGQQDVDKQQQVLEAIKAKQKG